MIKARLRQILAALTNALPWIFGTILASLAVAIVLLLIRTVGELLTAIYIIAEIIFGA